ncbi:MAG: hypothetical protein ABGW78_10730 [Pirellulales bacterium]
MSANVMNARLLCRAMICTSVLSMIVIDLPNQMVHAESKTRIVNITMEDQFRTRCETGTLLGDVVVLVFAERRGAEAAHELGKKLHVLFHPTAVSVSDEEWAHQPVVSPSGWPVDMRAPNVHAIPVACLSEVPRAMHPVVRARIRKESPEISVWLDYEDIMDQHFGLERGVPSVAILDTRGMVHSVHVGPFSDSAVNSLVTIIDEIRQASRPQIITAAAPGVLSR